MPGRLAFNRALTLQPFLKEFERRGGNVATVLRAAALEHVDLTDPSTLITGNALYRAVHEMAEALGDPFFAARAAEQFVKAGPAFVRQSYAASHTLAEFLPLCVLELREQLNNITYSLKIDADLTTIIGKRNFTADVPMTHIDAATVSIWVTFLRLVVKSEFSSSRISVIAQETKAIPSDIVSGTSILRRRWNGIQVAFPSEWLKIPLDLDWSIRSIPRGEFKESSSRRIQLEFLANLCLERIGERAFGLDHFARLLGVNPKELQRTLDGLGTSFQQMRDEVRRKKALELMTSNAPVSNEDIAEILGFSSGANFSRAFKRWTGVSPTEFQKNQ
ncbi:AraC family transcriptional regulator [Limibaculum sp. FT325]|uniref:AraC family transcriptional regulator n=1 Tax=Thermohalobaculum sediminis TaxID=2939436 RepID=UPI0020BF5729|nr:AraC family transcriptional regulator [Limibaculum sediminis]MCL5779305.1 AraC family transcriptional regulator [Limibaculum sediminis]